jgi:peptide deformylase
MAILKVARMGHPALRTKARPLEAAEIRSPGVQQLIDDMLETMVEYQGVGLAAPQVHEGVRIFVAGLPEDVDADASEEREIRQLAFINPEVTAVGRDVSEDWEGCLSIPEIRGLVPRARQIAVRGYDRHGKRIDMKVSGFIARVIQHETDHLDGVLFLDRMKSFQSLTFLEEFSRYWSRRDIKEE